MYILFILFCPISMNNLRYINRLETGTGRNTGSVSDDGIDYDWLPKEALNELSKLKGYSNIVFIVRNINLILCR
jgi:hypothetical protein